MTRRLFLVLAAFLFLLVGCQGPATPRASARVAVVSLAHGVVLATDVCRAYVKVNADAQPALALRVGTRCASDIRAARAALLDASDAVDAWDTGGRPDCAIGATVAALSDVLTIAGQDKALSDVVGFAAVFGKKCQ